MEKKRKWWRMRQIKKEVVEEILINILSPHKKKLREESSEKEREVGKLQDVLAWWVVVRHRATGVVCHYQKEGQHVK